MGHEMNFASIALRTIGLALAFGPWSIFGAAVFGIMSGLHSSAESQALVVWTLSNIPLIGAGLLIGLCLIGMGTLIGRLCD